MVLLPLNVWDSLKTALPETVTLKEGMGYWANKEAPMVIMEMHNVNKHFFIIHKLKR